MKRTELRRKTPMKRGTSQLARTGGLPRVRKGKERNGHDRKARADYVNAGDVCEYGANGICICHHRKGEKLTPEHFMRRNEHMTDEPAGLLRICIPCHNIANSDVTEAKVNGLWIKMNAIRQHPDAVRVFVKFWRSKGFNIEEVQNWIDAGILSDAATGRAHVVLAACGIGQEE